MRHYDPVPFERPDNTTLADDTRYRLNLYLDFHSLVRWLERRAFVEAGQLSNHPSTSLSVKEYLVIPILLHISGSDNHRLPIGQEKFSSQVQRVKLFKIRHMAFEAFFSSAVLYRVR
jgi:hypothetical protein